MRIQKLTNEEATALAKLFGGSIEDGMVLIQNVGTNSSIENRETKTIDGQAESVVSLFHAHLDECQQCRENPFGLCPKGEALLINCVSEPMPQEFQRFVSKHFWDLI